MIEEIILNYLKTNNLKAYMEKQPDMPSEYILIEKVGSGESTGIKDATLAIQSFSTSLYKTAKLNEKVKDIMRNSIALPSICRCELDSDYNYTLASSKEYRYQAVFNIFYY